MFVDIKGEDYEIEYNMVNLFRFMGNGFMEWEFDEKSDLLWYVEKVEIFWMI